MQAYAQWMVIFCVAILATGQVMFKQVAVNYNKLGTLFDLRVMGLLALAAMLYAISTGVWVWALRYMELSRAYPYFALGFVLGPLCGAVLFGETLSLRYALGTTLIIAGVILTGISK